MSERNGPYSFNQVLLDELRALRPDDPELRDFVAASAPVPHELREIKEARDANLRELFRRVGRITDRGEGLSALCLSGGGIRSATFNLGVLQGLAQARLLDRFDYLSSVSGGGYIAGWFKAWAKRKGTARVLGELTRTPPESSLPQPPLPDNALFGEGLQNNGHPNNRSNGLANGWSVGNPHLPDGWSGGNPLAPEPNAVDALREYSNYLTPRLGFFSPDTWTMAAIILRNLLLNWLVIVPVLAAAVMLPQLVLLFTHTPLAEQLRTPLLGAAMATAGVASYFVHSLRHLREQEDPERRQRRILWGGLLPLVLAAALLALALCRTDPSHLPGLHLVVFALLWGVGLPLFGWALHEPFWRIRNGQRWPFRDLAALVLSGVIAAALLVWLAYAVAPWLVRRPGLYVTLALPILLAVYLLARTLFVAFAGIGDEWAARRDAVRPTDASGEADDADREWWARFSGLVLLTGVLWLVGCGLVLLGWHLVFRLAHESVPPLMTAMGGLAGVLVALLGKSDQTAGAAEERRRPVSRVKERLLEVAAPVFVAVFLVLLAHGTVQLGRIVTYNPTLFRTTDDLLNAGFRASTGDLLAFAAGAVALLALGALMGTSVNANRFSLHGFYSNRLVRAFLGASNPERRPDPFTGFDTRDNVKLHHLWNAGDEENPECRRPLLLVNCTLNLVRGQQKLAWQQRKAESFSMTPLYCGNFFEGYRSAREYGGPGGITLGTALTVSGAAANPNAGCHSSRAMTFLLTLFNARLGAWLGNTNRHGDRTFRQSGPRWALRPLFMELFGQTDAQFPYVNLSDGGHFDNLGLYEMVLRRCRLILVSDAGQDRLAHFGDLGNAIRKIRIDFGIPIEFTERIRIAPREEGEAGTFCAIGRIRYAEVDGADAADGTLLYFKPALYGRGEPIPYDVFSYSRSADTFPHEPTQDQWFSESQFESYRALGLHAFRQATQGLPADTPTLDHLRAAVEAYARAPQAERQVQVHAVFSEPVTQPQAPE